MVLVGLVDLRVWVWVLGADGDALPGSVMADFILDRCTPDTPLAAFVPYRDSDDQTEGVHLTAVVHEAAYRLDFFEKDLGYAVLETFSPETLVTKLPAWLQQQFDFLYYLLSK
jgi:hypothetical protein